MCHFRYDLNRRINAAESSWAHPIDKSREDIPNIFMLSGSVLK
jgi:hypothetical protein